jgi:hypothetical protein
LSRTNFYGSRDRTKSVSTLSRPYTAPLQRIYEEQNDIESDDEITAISISRLTSGKHSIDRASSVISSSALSQHPVDININNDDITTKTPINSSNSHRITWPVKLKVFALQDENEARKQYLAWRAEQRKLKARRVSKSFFDIDLEKKHRASIRRREEIEAYATPELIEEHKIDDPIFAKRFRQLKVAVRSGKLPNYDPNDCEINVTMTKSKIERARSALITAKQSKIKTFYRNQQNINDQQLSIRIKTFLERVKKLKEEPEHQV